ncbi:hypothetical protein [Candidatus Neptunochlamydia vexilliferae]|uniref:rRNA-processing protein n=1 Tax=Candidatus Neptunichlamydia vexilliferae TaxID=1651774 RepID=A0ABS0B1K6_9BACT|nr:hypothetical protein [Candidatus Neptunochlamydia vexilliferae]MBF5060287.1 hypothetical protein [Candidatus Neptunochlamydia vexilliferae]
MPKTSKAKNMPARPDKTIDWLGKSREEWKHKTLNSKAQLKVAKQAQKRARASREKWKEECERLKAERAKNKITQAKQEVEIRKLKAALMQLEQEKED